MKPRGTYFGAGPAMLPEHILEQAQMDLMNWQGCGVSILEVGHRSPEFMQLLQETEQFIRDNLSVPDTHEILFIGQAARLQFSAIPLNFLHPGEKASFIVTGIWSEMAYEEAKRLLPNQIECLGSSKDLSFMDVPKQLAEISKDSRYLYFTPNETIHGVSYSPPEQYKGYEWVADMTSCLFSQPIDISQYGLIFAGAQKNLANSGLTLVIVKKSWLARPSYTILPKLLDYRTSAQYQSLYATPPTFNCYIAHQMMLWIKHQGGVQVLAEKNQKKAQLLYDFIDSSDNYHALVDKSCRSLMNVCFTTGSEEADTALLKAADAAALYGLKGHKLLGGLRASLYNAMPLSGVQRLIDFLSSAYL